MLTLWEPGAEGRNLYDVPNVWLERRLRLRLAFWLLVGPILGLFWLLTAPVTLTLRGLDIL